MADVALEDLAVVVSAVADLNVAESGLEAVRVLDGPGIVKSSRAREHWASAYLIR